jgi:hypothetical protein
MLRAFRVLRIFGRLWAICSIINALSNSLIPVLNAFFIMAMVIGLYAAETWVDGTPNVRDDGTVDWPTAAFVMSFVIVVNWTLFQVSVAVLLDNFITETARKKNEIQALEMEELRAKDTMGNVLDTFIKIMATEYIMIETSRILCAECSCFLLTFFRCLSRITKYSL